MPRRPILLALLLAGLTTVGVLLFVRSGQAGSHATVGERAPSVVGMTLDGAPFDLAALAGHPVLVNFWGPSCVPCREEFPLLAAKLARHAADGLAIVGVLTDDPPEPARHAPRQEVQRRTPHDAQHVQQRQESRRPGDSDVTPPQGFKDPQDSQHNKADTGAADHRPSDATSGRAREVRDDGKRNRIPADQQ